MPPQDPRTTTHLRHRRRAAAAALALGTSALLGLGACAGGDAATSGQDAPGAAGADTGPASGAGESGGSAPHGHVEGASELSEPALSLLGVSGSGEVTLLDLAEDSSQSLTTLEGVGEVASDGRFLVGPLAAGGVAVVDSGVWTVDHGDHQHYYRAPARSVGTLPDLQGPASVVSNERLSVVGAGDTAVLLDREKLGAGEIVELARTTIDPGSTPAPLGAGWVVVRDGQVVVLDEGGTAVAGISEPCADPRAGTTTRVGVVLNCEGGVVLATVGATDAAPALERIDLPEGTDPAARPHSFNSRPGRPGVAALDDTGGYWLLDTRQRTWTHVDSDAPLVAVAAVDDRQDRVVGIDAEGRVHVWADGAPETTTEPLAATDTTPADLHVDARRTYVRGSTPGQVLEIDVADGARVARSLDLPGLRSFVEVGL